MTIKQKQCLLSFLGYYEGAVNGIWKDECKGATTRFQEDFGGIAVDGICGPETEKALRHAVAYGMPTREVQDEPESGDFWDDIEFFDREEFRCKCYKYHTTPYCDGYPAEPKEMMVRLADRARKHFGKPGHVISGLRCRQHNADSDGAENSQHMYGEACDLRIDGVTADQLLAYMKKQPEVRYAYKINDTNVHFDIPKGER